jgi:hypothetical protein
MISFTIGNLQQLERRIRDTPIQRLHRRMSGIGIHGRFSIKLVGTITVRWRDEKPPEKGMMKSRLQMAWHCIVTQSKSRPVVQGYHVKSCSIPAPFPANLSLTHMQCNSVNQFKTAPLRFPANEVLSNAASAPQNSAASPL